jgi:hypothetical protein
MPAPPRPRVTAADRAQRRLRIYARLQEGWSHEAIAAEERLSRERVRQIAKEILDRREVDPDADYLRLQMARLDPALRLAGEKVAAGEVTAIDRLLRVLDRMDKYHGAAAAADAEIEAGAGARGLQAGCRYQLPEDRHRHAEGPRPAARERRQAEPLCGRSLVAVERGGEGGGGDRGGIGRGGTRGRRQIFSQLSL